MNDNKHTTDEHGFDYMDNSGLEEQDRDWCGMYIAVALIAVLTAFQYLQLY